MVCEPFPGVNTIFKAMQNNLLRFPDAPLLGTKVKGKYEWLTWTESMTIAEDFSAGMMKLDMVPEFEAEGRKWRFFGIQSKNCKEWTLANMGGMFRGMTSVGLYDTLGE